MPEFKCEVNGCGAEFDSEKKLRMHKLGKHRKEQGTEPQPRKQPEQPQQPNLSEELKAFGIEPEQVMAILSPLVEASVVKILEKMQLGETINKRMSEVETKLSGQFKAILEPLQQVTNPQAGGEQPSGSDTQPQNTQLRDTILASLAQKLIGGNSLGGLEQITKTLELASNVANVVMKPYMEGQRDTLRQLNELLRLSSGLGLTPEQRQKMVSGYTEGTPTG